ncbi:2-hydroxyacid dehydrogenase [Ferrimonas balearica]|uniref:2-hydroxyacid dehydrogenase n=1 Tax=Ferrimonas balearica TaxID=44012 RepID=UPI001C994A62|nr:2-hydroxyacid dehydrogenase [Ferrimonas balearica]MBY5920474.1 2-hydroxyacid dehydrogenase [Ferrimonas balearica]MBY5996841.1 2-hydroxyacid dehydrogenase [Ferrimonas balearica]
MEPKRVAVFSSKPYDKHFLDQANDGQGMQLEYFENRLRKSTMRLAEGYDAVSCFVNDIVDRTVLEHLVSNGIRMIALRCAGFNNVDLEAAKALGVQVARVPGYSPESVAEHTVAMILSLNRRLTKAYNRVKEHNFDLDGLLGFNLQKSTVGIIGTGKIGLATMRALSGFGCRLLCHDPYPSDEAAKLGEYCDLDKIYRESDVISLHCPLTDESYHLINEASIAKMKQGVMLINTSRGALVNAQHALDGMKQGKIGYLGLDVYELEGDIFFRDLSGKVLHDDVFALLLSYPNVLVTGHQGYFTREALTEIGQTTIDNLAAHFEGRVTGNEL